MALLYSADSAISFFREVAAMLVNLSIGDKNKSFNKQTINISTGNSEKDAEVQ